MHVRFCECDMFGEVALPQHWLQGRGMRDPLLLFVQLDLRRVFLAPEGELPVVLCVLTFSKRFWGRIGPESSLSVSSFSGTHLPGPWESEARLLQMRHLMVILLPLAKHKTPPPLPPSPFVPPQTLPWFWREGEVILCMCEPAFW